MIRLFDQFKIGSKKLILVEGSYDLRQNILQGTFEEFAVPQITINETSLYIVQSIGIPSFSEQVTISGKNMLGKLEIFAPEGFEISLEDTDSAFANFIEINSSSYKIPETIVYVRMNASDYGTYSGRIKFRSSYMENTYIDLLGDVVDAVKYGYIYNWPAIINPLNLTNTGWRVPTRQDAIDFFVDCDEDTELSESPPFAQSTHLFAVMATYKCQTNYKSGYKDNSSDFGLDIYYHLWINDPELYCSMFLRGEGEFDNNISPNDVLNYKYGFAVRLVRDATSEELEKSNGAYCTPYEGNDGTRYRTIKIGNKVWLGDNLAETKYRNGDDIPITADQGIWNNDESGLRYVYGEVL